MLLLLVVVGGVAGTAMASVTLSLSFDTVTNAWCIYKGIQEMKMKVFKAFTTT